MCAVMLARRTGRAAQRESRWTDRNFAFGEGQQSKIRTWDESSTILLPKPCNCRKMRALRWQSVSSTVWMTPTADEVGEG